MKASCCCAHSKCILAFGHESPHEFAPALDALTAAEWLVEGLPQPPGQPTALEILRRAFAAARAEGAAVRDAQWMQAIHVAGEQAVSRILGKMCESPSSGTAALTDHPGGTDNG